MNSESPFICDDHAYYSDDERCPKCVELEEAFEGESISLLPVEIGFQPTHKTITNELIRRVLTLLTEGEYKLKSQTSAEDYCGNFEESLRLEFGDKLRLNFTLTTLK